MQGQMVLPAAASASARDKAGFVEQGLNSIDVALATE